MGVVLMESEGWEGGEAENDVSPGSAGAAAGALQLCGGVQGGEGGGRGGGGEEGKGEVQAHSYYIAALYFSVAWMVK